MKRSLDPARVYYREETTTTKHDFHSYLDHPQSHQEPFSDWVRQTVTLILHGPQFEEFVKRANVELMSVSRYNELFKVTVIHDTCGNPSEPIQYNIVFETGLGEQDAELLAFIRQFDPRVHGWPAERGKA